MFLARAMAGGDANVPNSGTVDGNGAINCPIVGGNPNWSAAAGGTRFGGRAKARSAAGCRSTSAGCTTCLPTCSTTARSSTRTLERALLILNCFDLEHPDWTILDLDPKEAPFSNVVKIARVLGKLLRAIGIEPYLVSSAMIAVIAQRLVRVICPACRTILNATLTIT